MSAIPPASADLSAGALLSGTIDLLRAHPWALMLPLAILGLVGAGDNREPDWSWNVTEPADALALLPFFAFLGLVAILILVVLFVVYAVAIAVTTRVALAAIRREERADPRLAFNDLRPQLGAAVGTFALLVLVVILGFLLLIVPGIILLAGLVPWMAVVVAEKKSGSAALQRAWDLTRGHRLDLFLLGLLGVVLSVLADVALSWVPFVGNAAAGFAGGAISAAGAALGALYYERRVAAPAAPAVAPPPYAPATGP